MMARGTNSKILSRVALIGASLAFIIFLLLNFTSPARLYVEMANDNEGDGQIFVNSGTGYRPDKVSTFSLMPDGKTHIYGVDLINSLPSSLRLDPGGGSGSIEIRNITFESPIYRREFSCSDLHLLHDLKRSQNAGIDCKLMAVDGDPYLDFEVFTLSSFSILHVKWHVLALGLAYAIATYFLVMLGSQASRQEVPAQVRWLM